MSQHIQFSLPRELALAMNVPLMPRTLEQSGIVEGSFNYTVGAGDVFQIDCTRELAAGFVEGLGKMIDQDHPEEIKRAGAVAIGEIVRAFEHQRDAAGN